MIEKSKFREKLLSAHTSSSDLKVLFPEVSWRCAFVSGPSLKRKNRLGKSTPSPAPTHRSKFISPSTESMESPSMSRITSSPSITPSMNRKYSRPYLGHHRHLQGFDETASATPAQPGYRHVLCLRTDRFRQDIHHEWPARADSK